MFLVPLESGDLPHPEDWAMTPWSEAAKSKKKRDTDNISHRGLEARGTVTAKVRSPLIHNLYSISHSSSGLPLRLPLWDSQWFLEGVAKDEPMGSGIMR